MAGETTNALQRGTIWRIADEFCNSLDRPHSGDAHPVLLVQDVRVGAVVAQAVHGNSEAVSGPYVFTVNEQDIVGGDVRVITRSTYFQLGLARPYVRAHFVQYGGRLNDERLARLAERMLVLNVTGGWQL